MKSIWKYVSCCGGAAAANDEEEMSRKEETAAFAVPTPLRETKRQKSRRDGTAKAVHPDQKKKPRFHWKPTLWAISENKVPTDRELVSLGGVVGPDQKIVLKTKLQRSNTSNKKFAQLNKVDARSYSDNSGWESPLMMPSFSPPTFVF